LNRQGETLNDMPVETIQPNSHLRIKYPVPRDGWIEYLVEADRPVTTFILDDKGLGEFYTEKSDDIYSYYGGFSYRRNHHQELKLPFKGSWYLLIVNDDKRQPVAVHYEVSA
jgi:hypothetical protein